MIKIIRNLIFSANQEYIYIYIHRALNNRRKSLTVFILYKLYILYKEIEIDRNFYTN